MKYAFLALGGLSALLAWNFSKDLSRAISRKMLEETPAAAVQRSAAIINLVIVAAAVLAVLVCAVGFTVHLRLDRIEAQLGIQ